MNHALPLKSRRPGPARGRPAAFVLARVSALASVLALALGTGLGAAPARAADLYVAPEGQGAAAPDGSRARPYGSVQEAIEAGRVAGGDRILLMDGEHGALRIVRAWFKQEPLRIEAEHPHQAHVTFIGVQKATGIDISGLNVWPLTPGTQARGLANIGGSRIRLIDLDLRGKPDAPETYLDWTKEDWRVRWRANGVRLSGVENALIDSRLTGVAFGVTVLGRDAEVRGNRIEGFSGDALRGLADGGRFIRNRIENCVRVNANHMDAFQAWAPRGKGRMPLRDLLLDGNTILEWTGPADHPSRCQLQGLSLFDGPFENVSIVNNLITSSAYHGIALFTADHSRVVNNTVMRPDGKNGGAPWVTITLREKGVSEVVVANNVGLSFRNIPNALKRNAVARVPGQMFTDPLRLDFTPKAGGPLIGVGDAAVAPDHDILGRPRPAGAVDLGAFQSQ